MKKVLFFLFGWGVLTYADAQEWQMLNPKITEKNLNSISFSDDNNGFIAGYKGTIVKSADGGETWRTVTSGTTLNLYSVCFSGANTGFAVGDSGVILKTNDKGNTWQKQESGTTLPLYSIVFPDHDIGYAVGGIHYQNEEQVVLKTTDGGKTWDPISTGINHMLSSVFFLNAIMGFAVGDSGLILKTDDGGLSWDQQVTGMNNMLTSIFFLDSVRGFVTTQLSYILFTIDGGITWEKQFIDGLFSFSHINFVTSETGYITGWDNYLYEAMILKTNNGGTSWTEQLPGIPGGYLWSSFFRDPDHGIAVGSFGAIFQTKDGGSDWTNLNSFTMESFGSTCFLDKNTVFAAGSNGTIWKTTNGGLNWEGLPVDSSGAVWGIAFFNLNTGYCGFKNDILKTTNGGQTWETLIIDNSPFLLQDFHCVDKDIIYAIGYNGGIYKTINGGETWISQSSGNIKNLYSVSFTCEDTGYIAGQINSYSGENRGFILRTTNGGGTWDMVASLIPCSLDRVYFLTPEIGFAIGDTIYPPYGNKVLKTIDGGITWSTNYTSSSLMYRIAITFADLNTGYLAGRYGEIVKTADQGTTWIKLNLGTTTDLGAICAPDVSTAYAFGGYGTILKYQSGVGFGDVSGQVSFLKVFPNPSSGAVSVETSNVSGLKCISLYSITGQVLIKRRFYENKLSLNISTLNAGIYFLKVTGADMTETRKIIKE